MQKMIIINGPNLNLLGKREVHIYGDKSFEDYFSDLVERFSERTELEYFQSNHEGALIDKLHEVGFSYSGIVLNGGAFTHTSLAITDAIAGIETPVVEVHISNIHAREKIRHSSMTGSQAVGSIVGLGLQGYDLAIEYLLKSDYG